MKAIKFQLKAVLTWVKTRLLRFFVFKKTQNTVVLLFLRVFYITIRVNLEVVEVVASIPGVSHKSVSLSSDAKSNRRVALRIFCTKSKKFRFYVLHMPESCKVANK